MRYFLAFKSYGDTVITCQHLRKKSCAEDVLLCAEHLRPLVNAIGYEGAIVWLSNGSHSVPAFFDIRKHGFLAAVRSAYQLRHAIASVAQPGDKFVFDRIGWRQRYLAAGYLSEDVVSGQENIYLDYECFLGVRSSEDEVVSCGRHAGSIGIFPDSRISQKEIPHSLLDQIVSVLRAIGRDVRIVRTGPGREVETFNELTACIRSFSAIVSADSLPAHLAEYLGCSMYVFSPVTNDYWLPKSALEMCSHSLFHEPLDKLRCWAECVA